MTIFRTRDFDGMRKRGWESDGSEGRAEGEKLKKENS